MAPNQSMLSFTFGKSGNLIQFKRYSLGNGWFKIRSFQEKFSATSQVEKQTSTRFPKFPLESRLTDSVPKNKGKMTISRQPKNVKWKIKSL